MYFGGAGRGIRGTWHLSSLSIGQGWADLIAVGGRSFNVVAIPTPHFPR